MFGILKFTQYYYKISPYNIMMGSQFTRECKNCDT